MYIVDSHCHLDRLDLTQFDGKLENALSVADKQGIKEFLCVCINLSDFDKVLDIAKKYPQIYASVGVHPTEILQNEPSVDELVKLADDKNIIAIGESGLDYFHLKREEVQWQRERFRTHIKASQKTNKPIIIHTREAKADTLKIMQEESASSGVMHCFVEDYATAMSCIEMGFYISFSGVLTFNSAKELQETAKKIPLDKILVETDSPYLAPVPLRGKPNHPANTYFVLERLANLRGISINEAADATTNNFKTLFNL
jgi:TatD DNase family protein